LRLITNKKTTQRWREKKPEGFKKIEAVVKRKKEGLGPPAYQPEEGIWAES